MKKIWAVFLSVLIILMTGCSGQNSQSSESIPALTDKYVSTVYPTSPVKVIVPYAEGGGTDKVARSVVSAAEESFPQGITVENIVGEGGATGMREGANAEPDGSVITMITVELTTLPHTNDDAGILYDQFKPILMVNSAYSAITVNKDAPWNTLEEFIADSKTNKLKIGNSGVGAIWHLASAGLAEAAGVEFEYVPYDGGSTEAVAALESGAVDAVAVSYAEVLSEINAGNLKALAVLAPERLEEAPDVPTAREAGYDTVIGTWRGFGVPKDTPDEIVAELTYILSKAAGSMEFVQFMVDSGNSIEILDSDDFYKRMASDNELFKELIESLGL